MVVRQRLAQTGGGLLPDEGVSLRNVLEILINTLTDLNKSTINNNSNTNNNHTSTTVYPHYIYTITLLPHTTT